MPHYNLTICCHLQFYNDSDLPQSNQFETSWEKTKPPYYLITRDNTHGNAQLKPFPFFIHRLHTHLHQVSIERINLFLIDAQTLHTLMLSVHT